MPRAKVAAGEAATTVAAQKYQESTPHLNREGDSTFDRSHDRWPTGKLSGQLVHSHINRLATEFAVYRDESGVTCRRANRSIHKTLVRRHCHESRPRSAPSTPGAAARRPGHVRSIFDRHDVSGFPGNRRTVAGESAGDAADTQCLHHCLRADVAVARPDVRWARTAGRLFFSALRRLCSPRLAARNRPASANCSCFGRCRVCPLAPA